MAKSLNLAIQYFVSYDQAPVSVCSMNIHTVSSILSYTQLIVNNNGDSAEPCGNPIEVL